MEGRQKRSWEPQASGLKTGWGWHRRPQVDSLGAGQMSGTAQEVRQRMQNPSGGLVLAKDKVPLEVWQVANKAAQEDGQETA